MRGALAFLALSGAACGSVTSSAHDANTVGDDDAPPDTASCPKMLLVGGTDVAPQGWSVVMQQPNMLTYGPDYVRLQTTTNGMTTSGQLLLNYPGAVETGKPFKLQVVMLVESVSPHDQFDSAAAILGSFMPPFGSPTERSQMIYLDANKIGWAADDAQPFLVSVTNNMYHTYELSVDAASTATVTIDGIQALTRIGFMSNGAIAIGDQTNNANVDSVLRIHSVTKLCP